ncbi:hypothetical protein [Plastoroseomonas hellenica]|uniref:hypothetical protein n=1 Tax=Plastoroseomonas hellenica TaxID=2687306 RepID=UPI001BA4882C|nr:hypothetical protein [Plastoroseomonas hellenica]MBR0644011.1 hypothetical protein [Plastoroseomonas hellenica]
MTALAARLSIAKGAPIGAPSATAIGRVILMLEAARAASRPLDAEIYRALGWQVERVPGIAWRARGPAAVAWGHLPHPSGDASEAGRLVPWGWSYGSSGNDAAGTFNGWCRDDAAAGLTYFEIRGRSTALALATAALHGHRELLLRAERAALAPSRAWECICGWLGTPEGLRAGRCPDCSRAVIDHSPHTGALA